MAILYIVSTPIGNLEDITLRALKILRQVDFILCEDTRVTRKLLTHYHIHKPLISYHQHSKLRKIEYVIDLLQKGKNLALVSEAGTPGISDPGNKLIAHLAETRDPASPRIIPIPGPSALTASLSVSGLPTDNFLFLGFIPHKKGRQKFLREVLESKRTVVFYESCHRIIKCLEDMNTLINTDVNPVKSPDIKSRSHGAGIDQHRGDEKRLVVCRELTKKFETIYRGSVEEVLEQIKKDPIKGEYVVVVEGIHNKKSEIRNSKQILNYKSQIPNKNISMY